MLTDSRLANLLQRYAICICSLGRTKLLSFAILHITAGRQFRKETVNHEVQGAQLRFVQEDGL